MGKAIESGLVVEVICVLDRPDPATRELFGHATGGPYFPDTTATTLIEVDYGDPGLARNDAVRRARGDVVAIADADNLFSHDWFVRSVESLRDAHHPVVLHPELLVIFEARHVLWRQVSSTGDAFHAGALYSANYWDATCVTTREILLELPYQTSPPAYEAEDWHWNTTTLFAGIAHEIVPQTVLFYRAKRSGSWGGDKLAARTLRRTPFLSSREVAMRSLGAAPPDIPPPRTVPRLLETVLDEWRDAGRRSAVLTNQFSGLVAAGPGAAGEAHLSPGGFTPSHCRLLYPALAQMSDASLARHFLDVAGAAPLRGLLDDRELLALESFDATEYRTLNLDLHGLSDDELVAHFVHYGRTEGRRVRLTAAERAAAETDLPAWLLTEWTAAHEIEPSIPAPTSETWTSYDRAYPPSSCSPAGVVWWRVVQAMPDRSDVLFVASSLEMDDVEGALIRYVAEVRRHHPDHDITVVVAGGGGVESVVTGDGVADGGSLPEDVTLVELPAIEGYGALSGLEQSKLLADLVVQYGPSVVHILEAQVGFDAVESYGAVMGEPTKIFLSTFAIKRGPGGELQNPMFGRLLGFFDHIGGVIVHDEALVEQFWDLCRFPREKFFVHPASSFEEVVAATPGYL